MRRKDCFRKLTTFHHLETKQSGLSYSMLIIRTATAQDASLIVQLIRELAEYERAPQEAVATPEDILRDGFSERPKFRVLIAEWSSQPAGFALFFNNYSTWRGRPGLFLEDLFVRPEFRKRGIGKSLLIHLAKIALAEGCGRFEWQVLDWNKPAIEFYQSLGARVMKEWLTMRVTGTALPKLASSPPSQKSELDCEGMLDTQRDVGSDD
jgi:GNAT superfamily N-acetyltransferase